jgi:amino acid transporter
MAVAASTLVSDFVGYFTIGMAFLVALMIAFVINLLLGLSCAELSTTYPKAGALYEYGSRAFPWPAASVITALPGVRGLRDFRTGRIAGGLGGGHSASRRSSAAPAPSPRGASR